MSYDKLDTVDGNLEDFKVGKDKSKGKVEKPKKCKKPSKDAAEDAIKANHRERMNNRAIRRDSFYRQQEAQRKKLGAHTYPNLRKDHPKMEEYLAGKITIQEAYA